MTLAIALLVALAAEPPSPLPAGYTCEDVRRIIAEKGKPGAILWGLEHGISLWKINAIRRQCRV